MTKERARALIPILQAIIDEKQTQHRYDHWTPGKWEDTETLEFHLNDRVSWRIKPEPREGWLIVCGAESFGFSKKEDAERSARRLGVGYKAVRVREIDP